VGALVCFFVLSPALFTPWGFGLDYTNHLWLVWQQSLAISDNGHPTLYLQTPDGIFEPFYAFYGGTLYAVTGGLAALIGGHPYPVYVASFGASFAFAYGGMWWLGRLLGLSRWVAHLPAFVFVTGGYYLTDAFARGAWPELVALSAIPMFLAGAIRLTKEPWGAGAVTLFVVATVALTGSHNLTLFWSVVVIGPVAVATFLVAGGARPPLRIVVKVVGLALLAAGINAWFLVLDLAHGADVQAWVQNAAFLEEGFFEFLYFDNLENVLDPLRGTPPQSTTYGLTIAPPMVAFGLSVALAWLAWPQLRESSRLLRALWLILLAAMGAIVFMLVMPGSWWVALGQPFTNIQFPYRLAAWLLLGVALQLGISLYFARGLAGRRRQLAIGLVAAMVVVTVAQAAAQLYAGPRLDGTVNYDLRARTKAFEGGPTTPPSTFYDPYSYADSSRPVVETAPERVLRLPTPAPGQTRLETEVELPPGPDPIATNIAAGPYVVRVEGMPVVGRTPLGMVVVEPPPDGARRTRLTVAADGGVAQLAAAVISIICLTLCLVIVGTLAPSPSLRYRRGSADPGSA
jgi:hypothetical protein